MGYVLVKYLHLLSILVLFSCIVVEHLLIKKELSPEEIRKLVVVDAVYGVSAVMVLMAGLILWFLVGKPAVFYTLNPVFHVKVSLFVVVGLLSIYPTRFFFQARRSTAQLITVPKAIKVILRLELVLLMLLPLLAILSSSVYRTRNYPSLSRKNSRSSAIC